MSRSVAVSASLTRTPPKPRKDPSTAASATFWLISRSQALNAAASFGALASTIAEPSRRLANERFRGLRLGKAFAHCKKIFQNQQSTRQRPYRRGRGHRRLHLKARVAARHKP